MLKFNHISSTLRSVTKTKVASMSLSFVGLSLTNMYLLNCSRVRNVEAAIDVGFIGIQFKDVDLLRKDLSHLGILTS